MVRSARPEKIHEEWGGGHTHERGKITGGAKGCFIRGAWHQQ